MSSNIKKQIRLKVQKHFSTSSGWPITGFPHLVDTEIQDSFKTFSRPVSCFSRLKHGMLNIFLFNQTRIFPVNSFLSASER